MDCASLKDMRTSPLQHDVVLQGGGYIRCDFEEELVFPSTLMVRGLNR